MPGPALAQRLHLALSAVLLGLLLHLLATAPAAEALSASGDRPRAAPTASFAVSPDPPVAGAPATLTSTSTTDGEPIDAEDWDLDGDGAFGDASGPKVTHVFETPGKHVVGLRVTAAGKSDASVRTLTVVAGPEPTPTPTVTPTPPPPDNAAPAGELAVQAAKASVVLDARSFADPDGTIVAYEWDFDGDGRFDANTGTLPTSSFVYQQAGPHDVGVRVTDDAGAVTTDVEVLTVAPPAPGCRYGLDLGFMTLAADCIRRDGDEWVLEGTVNFNGMEIKATEGETRLSLDTGSAPWRITSDSRVRLAFANTPLGHITLYETERDLDWDLPVGADAAGRGEPGIRLASARAGSGCRPQAGPPPVVCATLPGGFPLAGSLDLYLTGGLQLLVHANVRLGSPFNVTGRVALRSDVDHGLVLDSLGLAVRGADLGPLRVNELSVGYDAPPVDAWEGAADITLPTPQRAGVRGAFRFAAGSLESASAELRGARLPIGPGIFLNRFAGEFAQRPVLALGGGLGVNVVGLSDFDASFRYAFSTPALLHMDGEMRLLGSRMAGASVDYWSNGTLDFAGDLSFRYPVPTMPRELALVAVDGRIAGYVASPHWQVEGTVTAKVLFIDGEVRALANNDWVAACARVHDVPLGRATLRVADGRLEGALFTCDLGPYRVERPGTARAAQGGQVVHVGPGERLVNLEVTGAGDAPVVTVTAPGGERFTTAGAADEVVRSGPFGSVRSPAAQRTWVAIERPRAGAYRVTAAPGSAAVTQVRSAAELPPPQVRARVSGRGARRTLHYRFAAVEGRRVRFVEDGADTTRLIAVVSKPRGTVRFTPSDGRAGRRILAVVEQAGDPRATTAVTRFRAAGTRPGRPVRVRVRRRGTTAVVTWRRAAHADGYAVRVAGSDGRRESVVTRRRRITLRDVLPAERLTVTVRGERGASRVAGPPRRVKLPPTKRPRRTR